MGPIKPVKYVGWMETVEKEREPLNAEARSEVQWLLNAGILGQSTNLSRMFQFLCDQYFESNGSPIKEYTIAVEGLGRSEDFDPHIDPIVRVTAHMLRKRLKDFYAGPGAERALQIQIPRGSYTPSFVPQILPQPVAPQPLPDEAPAPVPTAPAAGTPPPVMAAPAKKLALRPWFMALSAAGLMLCLALYWAFQTHVSKSGAQDKISSVQIPANSTFRMLVGDSRSSFTDKSGQRWNADTYCSGGNSFYVNHIKIGGTVEPNLFLAGRKGVFHCAFPVAAGLYEAHLYFADTSGTEDASLSIAFSLNGKAALSLDVADYAPGMNQATEKLLAGISPEADGKIHLDFTGQESYLNAIELVPSTSRHIAPIRIMTNESGGKDTNGDLWLADRFFTSGRRSLSTSSGPMQNGILFSSSRVGHFRYSIPVERGASYTVRLYFVESWFSDQGGDSGKDQRLFDVACNGISLLKNFDVFAEGGRGLVTKSFAHVLPNGLGKIDLEFTPVRNYALLNGIEVVQE